MSSYITISLTPLQAALVKLALQEHQADYEAALNGAEISADKQTVEDIASYASITTDIDHIQKAIDIQLGLLNE